MITWPTSTVVPSSKSSACTTPSNGIGSSTAAFAVSTSQTTWPSVTVSPGWTYHLRISASVRPSPTSGILNSRMVMNVAPQYASERSTASSTLSRPGRYSSSRRAGGYGAWKPPTRSTGASRW